MHAVALELLWKVICPNNAYSTFIFPIYISNILGHQHIILLSNTSLTTLKCLFYLPHCHNTMASKIQILHHNIALALVLLMGFLAFEATSRTLQDLSMQERHQQWMARYGKTYNDPQEMEKRFNIFKQNVEYIDSFNNDGTKSYKLSINEFADLTNNEFTSSRNRFKGHMCSSIKKTPTFKYENVTVIPSSIDWRQKGAVTPIKNQGQCGMCFSKLNSSKLNNPRFNLSLTFLCFSLYKL